MVWFIASDPAGYKVKALLMSGVPFPTVNLVLSHCNIVLLALICSLGHCVEDTVEPQPSTLVDQGTDIISLNSLGRLLINKQTITNKKRNC